MRGEVRRGHRSDRVVERREIEARVDAGHPAAHVEVALRVARRVALGASRDALHEVLATTERLRARDERRFGSRVGDRQNRSAVVARRRGDESEREDAREENRAGGRAVHLAIVTRVTSTSGAVAVTSPVAARRYVVRTLR